jgi:hypothetical protein
MVDGDRLAGSLQADDDLARQLAHVRQRLPSRSTVREAAGKRRRVGPRANPGTPPLQGALQIVEGGGDP